MIPFIPTLIQKMIPRHHGLRSKDTVDALWRLEKIILDTLDFGQVVQKTVDSMLSELEHLHLGYTNITLALIHEESHILKQISIARTEESKKAFTKPFFLHKEISIPLSEKENYCVLAMTENRPYATRSVYDIVRPGYSKEEASKLQQAVGTQASMIYPIFYHNKGQGVMIFGMDKYETEVSEWEKDLIRSFADIVGLAVQNARLYTTLQDATDNLKKANSQLQELDRLKDEFVSLASHELRTPMTAIRGSLSTILDGYAGEIPSMVREFLTSAYNENERLIRLVNNLLNISRIESGRFTFNISKVSMDDVIKEVVGNLTWAASEKNLTLSYHQNGPHSHVLTDADKTREVLINLIGNAIKYTHRGGVEIKTAVKNSMLITSVGDTGSGIALEDQDLLFKKFSQIQGSYAKQSGGTGLGLYICKIIVEGLGGTIWLESTIGRGSTFFFSLPIAP